jgi:TPR repeat protein
MNRIALLFLLLFLAGNTASAADDRFEPVVPGVFHDLLRDASAAYDKKDYARAFELNQRAACAGDKTSQAILGRMYVLGQGVQKDEITGFAWIRLAADFSFADFTSLSRKLEAAMTPEQQKAGNAKAVALREKYGLAATNMSCHGESRRGVYLIDSVVCTPESEGGRLLLRRCVGSQVK